MHSGSVCQVPTEDFSAILGDGFSRWLFWGNFREKRNEQFSKGRSVLMRCVVELGWGGRPLCFGSCWEFP